MFNNRNEIRQFFVTAWQKYQNNQPTSPLEAQVIAIIKMHPEYQAQLNDKENIIDKDYRSDNNPFLHMGLHLSLLEQLSTNRPKGIIEIYQKLCHQHTNPHEAEHKMMEVMGDILWQAQQNKILPSDEIYITKLQQLLK